MNSKKVLLFAVGASLILSLFACNKSEKQPDENIVEDVVGTVGDENIYASEFCYYLNLDKVQMEEEAGVADKSISEKKEFWNTKEQYADRKQVLIDKTFSNLTELKTLLLAAKKDNVKLEQSELDGISQHIDEFIKNEGKGNIEEAERVMKEKNGVTLYEYRRMYEEYTLAYFIYFPSYHYQIEIRDDELKEEYEKNKDEYHNVVVKHVLISTKDSYDQPLPEDKVAEKKILADEILQKAKSGEDFESLVKQYSEDMGSKDSGGEYTFGRGKMVKEFEDWAFSAKEGDIGLVKSSFGFHIMKFIRNGTFEDQKNDLKIKMQRDRFTQSIEEMKKRFPLVKNQKVVDSLKLFY